MVDTNSFLMVRIIRNCHNLDLWALYRYTGGRGKEQNDKLFFFVCSSFALLPTRVTYNMFMTSKRNWITYAMKCKELIN